MTSDSEISLVLFCHCLLDRECSDEEPTQLDPAIIYELLSYYCHTENSPENHWDWLSQWALETSRSTFNFVESFKLTETKNETCFRAALIGAILQTYLREENEQHNEISHFAGRAQAELDKRPDLRQDVVTALVRKLHNGTLSTDDIFEYPSEDTDIQQTPSRRLSLSETLNHLSSSFNESPHVCRKRKFNDRKLVLEGEKENEELLQINTKLEDEIKVLISKNERLTAVALSHDECSKRKHELQSLQAEIEILKADQTRMKLLERQNEELKDKVSKAYEEKNTVMFEIDDLKKEKNLLQTKYDYLCIDKSEVEVEIHMINRENEKLTSENLKLYEALRATEKINESWDSKHAVVDDSATSLKLDTSRTPNLQHELDLERLKEVDKLEDMMKRLEDDKMHLEKENNDLKDKFNEKECESEERKKQLQTLSEERDADKRVVSSLQSDNENLLHIKSEFAVTSSKLEEMQEIYSKTCYQNNQLLESVLSLETNETNLAQSLTRLKAELMEEKDANDKKKADLKQLHVENETKKQTISSLQAKNEKLLEDMTEIEGSLDSALASKMNNSYTTKNVGVGLDTALDAGKTSKYEKYARVFQNMSEKVKLVKTLNAENTNLRSKLKCENDALKEKSASLESTLIILQNLVDENDAQKMELQDKEEKISALEKDLHVKSSSPYQSLRPSNSWNASLNASLKPLVNDKMISRYLLNSTILLFADKPWMGKLIPFDVERVSSMYAPALIGDSHLSAADEDFEMREDVFNRIQKHVYGHPSITDNQNSNVTKLSRQKELSTPKCAKKSKLLSLKDLTPMKQLDDTLNLTSSSIGSSIFKNGLTEAYRKMSTPSKKEKNVAPEGTKVLKESRKRNIPIDVSVSPKKLKRGTSLRIPFQFSK